MLSQKKRIVGVLAVIAAVTTTGVLGASGSPSESSLAGWPRQFGGSSGDYANAMTTSSSGDVYVAGSTSGTVSTTPNQGEYDAWLARYDKYGRLKWVQQFGSAATDDVAAVSVVGSSVYVTGITYGSLPGGSLPSNTANGGMDSYVARFDTSGNLKWIRQFGTAANDEATSATTLGGSLWVLGATEGAFGGLTPLGNGDGFLVQVSSSGTVKSSRLVGTDQYDYPTEIAASGRTLFIGGSTEGTFAGQSNAGGSDDFVMSISNINTGRESTWVREFGTATNETFGSLAVSGRSLYAGGATYGTFPGGSAAGWNDLFVIKYSTSGTFSWVRQFGTSESEELTSVAASSAGVVVVGNTNGAFDGFPYRGPDAFAASFSSAGEQKWLRQFGTSDADEVYSVSLRASDNYGGRIVVAGYTSGTVWGQVSAGSDDGFIATFVS